MKNTNETKISKRAAHSLIVFLVMSLMLVGIAIGEIPQNGLVGQWHFDGDAKDSSGKGIDGIIYGASFVNGKFGKAMGFNGIDNYIQLPQFNPIWEEGFSACAWAKFERDNDGNYERIVDLGNGNGDTYGDNILFARSSTTNDITIEVWAGTNGSLSRSDQIGGGRLIAKNGILVGEIAFYCGSVDKSGNMNLYRNGNLLANKKGLPVSNVVRTKNYIAHSNWNDANFKGIIDETHIYNRALSESEIKAIYEAGQITITSSPPGSEVLINGLSRGFASPTLFVSGISPASYAIKCKLSGYQDYDANIVLTPGSVANVNCTLSAVPSPSPSPTNTPTPTPTPVTTTPAKTTPTPSNLMAQPGTTEVPPSAQPAKSTSITGKIADAKTGDPVENATVSIGNKSTLTNANGEYDLTVEAGKQSMNVSKQGYEPLTRSVILSETGTMLDISLKQTSGETGKSVNLSLILVVLILIIAAVAIYFMWKKKKSPIEPKKTAESKKSELKQGETREKKKFCMFCHAPISLDSEYCNKCGKKQDETKRFCMNCGALMPSVPELCGKCSKMPPSGEDTKTCKNCGEVIPIVAKFCSACGAGQPE